MKILVTGAKGMIGSHLVTALLAEGYEVVGVDRAGEDSRSKMLSFFKADLADREGERGLLESDFVRHQSGLLLRHRTQREYRGSG